MKTFIFILLSIYSVSRLNAQPCSTPAQNLQKYWEYRERLKDFVVVGSDSGCSLISPDRTAGQVKYEDEPTPLGYYIGVLASEYYLLYTQASDTASASQKARTLEELYYALAAAVRLDQNAEGYWLHYFAGSTYTVVPGDLNGFMIRDDVSSNFLNDWENGDYVENDLNKGLSPPPNGVAGDPTYYQANTLQTSFITGINTYGGHFTGACAIFNSRRSGPNPLSTDELTQLFTGLAIVTKLLPAAGNPAYLGNNLTTMAQTIADRISQWINNRNNGVIFNPVTSMCASGSVWNSKPDFINHCKCDAAGSEPGALIEGNVAYGIQSADYAILYGFDPLHTYVPLSPTWSIFYKNVYIRKDGQEFIPLTLGTIGKSWGSLTGAVVNYMAIANAIHDAKHGDVDGLPLLYTVLWEQNTASYGTAYYDSLVSDAPCHGTIGNNGNYEWSQGERWVGGPNKPNQSSNDIFFGADYMLYFNLLCVAYPTLTGTPGNHYTPYFYIPAKKLRYPYLIETNYTESSEKNFAAADSIEAGNIGSAGDYIIANDNDSHQPLSLGNAQVHFTAGKLIDLMPGFDAQQGIYLFDASIDTSIHAMNCSECNPSYNVETLLPSGPPLPAGDTIPWFSTDTINNCKRCDTIHFLGIEGDTLGVSHWRWNFGNGDTSNSSHPYVIYCLSNHIDTATGNRDTAFQVTLIAKDSASGENDTLVTSFYIYCPAGIPLHHTTTHESDETTNSNKGYSFNLQPTLTNSTTSIQYTMPEQAQVTIRIHTLLGVNAGDIVNTVQNAGQYSVNFNARSLPPGIYYVSMLTSNFTKTMKLVVVK